MAGDWIKVRLDLVDDPDVMAIAAKLGADDPDLVLGKLVRIWAWANRHTTDGNAPSVTFRLLDRYANCDGLCAAMESVGWMASNDGGVTFPLFDRHMSDSAKKRALGKNRQDKHRARNAPSVTHVSRNQRDDSVTREEKRREESIEEAAHKKTEPPTAQPAHAQEIAETTHSDNDRDFQFRPVDWDDQADQRDQLAEVTKRATTLVTCPQCDAGMPAGMQCAVCGYDPKEKPNGDLEF